MTNRFLIFLAASGFLLSLASVLTVDHWLAAKVVSPATHLDTWHLITDLGDSKWMALLVSSLWIGGFTFSKFQPQNRNWPKVATQSRLVFFSVLIPGLAVLLIKFTVGRSRPYTGDDGYYPFTAGVDFASWPSGHTTTAFGFAVAVGLAIPVLRWPLILLAALVGYSRMVLEMHYLGDVIAGATLGTVGAVIIYTWLTPKKLAK